MLVLDHLAVACETLQDGVAWVEAQLGVPMGPGGKHPRYGTHNALLGLADGLYLEVIAIDPDAAPVAEPRWFGLDQFRGSPRLANWICATSDLPTTLDTCPAAVGAVRDMQRDDLTWQITVPDDGSLPHGGGFPTLIAWPDGRHPSASLPASGCRLTTLTVSHPEADWLSDAVPLDDARVRITQGSFGLSATFDTPDGPRVLT